jgi:nitrogen fixation/metabolism regulation signal transduction histidine kinase
MFPRYESRVKLTLALLVGLLLLANLLTLTLAALTPASNPSRGPVLWAVFIITVVASLPCIILLPRWLLRPYRRLVGEAERAPIARGAAPARDEAEFVLETFQGVVTKLQSQQRELEALSARASARAASAEKFSERIVASLPSGLITFDAQGHATMVNAPARALLEASGAAEGRPARELLRCAPDLAELVERCLETGELYRREEITARTAGGRARRLGATIAPIDPAPGQTARGALCLLTDITEVIELREAVALKKNLESLGEMAAGLAHEFKNALATLHSYAQLMQRLELDERGKAASVAMLREVRNLSAMVTAFLDFARPQPLELSTVSLRELIEDCAAELRGLFEARRVALSIEGDFPPAQIDERMLRQALLNILRNGAEAIDERATDRRVIARGARQRDAAGKDWAVIEIEDTGDGIREADLQKIFIPFFTTKAKGHGVGLALAHRVITDHGGALAAANGPNGAIFTIKLPL